MKPNKACIAIVCFSVSVETFFEPTIFLFPKKAVTLYSV